MTLKNVNGTTTTEIFDLSHLSAIVIPLDYSNKHFQHNESCISVYKRKFFWFWYDITVIKDCLWRRSQIVLFTSILVYCYCRPMAHTMLLMTLKVWLFYVVWKHLKCMRVIEWKFQPSCRQQHNSSLPLCFRTKWNKLEKKLFNWQQKVRFPTHLKIWSQNTIST